MLSEFLVRLTSAMEAAGVEYMVCGSVASIIHGVPRSTQDVDLVVLLTEKELPRLVAAFPEDEFYLSESAAKDAIRLQSQFNVIDLQTGWKADLIVRKNRAFSRTEFERRQRADVLGTQAWVASPEDTVLAKLEWSARSESSRQLNDVRGVISVSASSLDWDYLEQWAQALGVSELLRSIREE